MLKAISKVKIYSYHQNFPKLFEKEKEIILKTIGDYELQHIGSTAVPGLAGKGIIDILIAVNVWIKTVKIIKELQNLGYVHVHSQDNGRIFLSKKSVTKYKDTHIHLVKKGGAVYKNLLAFRDCLRLDKIEAKRYLILKRQWQKQGKNDRNYYRLAKTDYIKSVIKKYQGL